MLSTKDKNVVKEIIASPNKLGEQSIGVLLGTGAIIGLWQGFDVGGKVQKWIQKIPLVNKIPYFGSVGVGMFQLVGGIASLYFRRSKGMKLEKSVYAVMIINGAIDTMKGFAVNFKR